jgi:hypothetical protein
MQIANLSTPAISSNLPVEFGNAEDVDTSNTGWFIGFSDWTKSGPHSLRHLPLDANASGLCAKWFSHRAGDPNGQKKPLSTGRTVSILMSQKSEFVLEFNPIQAFEPGLTVTHTLRRAGDFVIWGPGLFHRAYGIQPATILTFRWESAVSAA